MKNLAVILVTFILVLSSCNKEKPMKKIIDESLSFAVKQYSLMYDAMKDKPLQAACGLYSVVEE